jgi:NADH-quinone oxidoreductase subunit G
VARSLTQISLEHGAGSIGALASAQSTVEELHMLTRLMHGLGSGNVDHRLRHADFSNVAAPLEGAPAARWLGTSVASLSTLDRAFVVGSFLRKDHPLFAQRIRQAARKGARVHSLHALQDDWLMPMAVSIVAAPGAWVAMLAEVAAAIALSRGLVAPIAATPGAAAQAIAESLLSGERKAVLLGNAAAQHPKASSLLALAQWIAAQAGASVGYLSEAANSVGAQLVGAMPSEGGLNAAEMLGAAGTPLKAMLLLGFDPAFDVADPVAADTALGQAEFVVMMGPMKPSSMARADVLLPVAPFTETSGSFVSAEGRLQSFHGVVKPAGDARPGWKVLRVLGNLLELKGFDFESSEDVLQQALGDPSRISAHLNNASTASSIDLAYAGVHGLERVSSVPIYASDALVRSAPGLQATADARAPVADLPTALWTRLGLEAGAKVRASMGAASIVLPARLDASLAPSAVRIPAGHPATAALGPMFGALSVEKA